MPKKLKLLAASFLQTNWAVFCVYLIITLVVLSPVLIFHRTTFFTNLDNVDQFYTWYQKLSTSLHHGYFPVWNANVFGGQSFAGELQPGIFYPLNILWVMVFGNAHGISQTALDFLVALHFALAGFGSYLVIKELRARKWSAFLAGIIFAFSGVIAIRAVSQTAIFYGLSLLPYPLYFLARFHHDANRRIRWLIFSGISLGLIILSGHIQPFFHALLVLGIFEIAVVHSKYKNLNSLKTLVPQSIKSFLVILIATIAVALPQVWVSSSYLNHTYRIQAAGYAGPGEKIDYKDFAKAFNLDIHEFANLIDPVSYPIRDGNNIFIGLAPLAIIGLAVVLANNRFRRSRLWEQESFFVTSLLVFSFIAMLGYLTWLAVVLYELPFVYQIRQLGRYSILFDLALVMLLAIGLEIFVNIRLTKRQKRNLMLAGLFLLINAVYLFALRKFIFSTHHALQTALLGTTLVIPVFIRNIRLRILAVSALIILTALVNTKWFLPTLANNRETPKVYSVAPELINTLESTSGKYRVEIIDSAIPVNIGNMYDIQTIGGYAATVYAPYFEFVHKDGLSDKFTRDLLGVQLEVKKQPGSQDDVVYSDPDAKVYVVKRPDPIGKLFTSSKPGSTSREDYHSLPSNTIRYEDQYQAYSINLDKNTNVIFSEIAYKGWIAKIDGQTVNIATYKVGPTPLFKSLVVPAGNHKIEFIYKPFVIF